MSTKFDHDEMRRFIPYVQMYEFEGLLFSDPQRFASGIDQPQLASEFAAIREEFSTPEEINDSPMTATSKRIEGLYRRYDKVVYGSLAAMEIGLPAMRKVILLRFYRHIEEYIFTNATRSEAAAQRVRLSEA